MNPIAGNEKKEFDFVCYGELLWDILPTGAKPGGAPMNVAFHLNRLGHHPAVITRIGKDKLGDDLMNILHEKNIDTSFVQVDENVQTGIVHANPNEHGEMNYEIVAPAAWDHISWNQDFDKLFDQQNFLVFGSLICRNEASRKTLFRLLESAVNKVLDINLRPPHYNEQLIFDLLSRTDVVKLNRAELDMISRWSSAVSDEEDQVKNVQDRFKIPTVIVTLGGDGAIMNIKGQTYRHHGYEIKVEDTVGSGDAFLAALLSGLIRKKAPEDCLSFACALGALVTSRKGAWPDYALDEVKMQEKSKQKGTG